VCCSKEQIHTQEFIRTVESAIVIDSDSDQTTRNVLPSIGELQVTSYNCPDVTTVSALLTGLNK